MFLGRSYSTIHLCLAGQIRADLENQDSTMHLTFSPIQPNRDSWILLSLTFVGFWGIWFFWWVVWVFFSISSYCSFELQFLFDRGALEKNYKDTSFQPSCLKDSQSTGGYSGAVALPVYPVLNFSINLLFAIARMLGLCTVTTSHSCLLSLCLPLPVILLVSSCSAVFKNVLINSVILQY